MTDAITVLTPAKNLLSKTLIAQVSNWLKQTVIY